MLSDNDKIEPGILKLQSFSKPPLTAGDYTVHSQLMIDGHNIPANTLFEHKLGFSVKGPRFSIDESLVYSMYPVPGSTGAYHTTLPHIVFTRKTLLWERAIGDSSGVQQPVGNSLDGKPWMTLLLLTGKEIKENAIAVTAINVEDIKKPAANLIVPDISLEGWELESGDGKNKTKNKVSVTQLPLNLFKSIVPLPEELDYLAHTRQIDMSDKDSTDSNPKGWFSAMIGNRLPQPEQSNSVFLVSLEGHAAHLNNNIQPGDANKQIRIVVLRSWSFTEQGATFGELVEQLINNTKPLRIEMEDEEKKNIPAASLKALHYGYTPVNHDRRNGEQSVSWYRGPLIPVSIPNPDQYTYENADQALRFDPDSGMFDISYAVAWQLGRLLALQNAGFASAISNWKSDYKKDRPLMIAKDILKKEKQIDPDELSSMINDAESDEILFDYLLELWNSDQI